MLNQPFFVPAIITLFLAIPLILGLMPRNRGYGVRTVKTLSNDTLWYRANKFGGWTLLFSSVVYLVVAAIVPYLPPPGDDVMIWLLHLCAFVFPLILSVILIQRYVKGL